MSVEYVSLLIALVAGLAFGVLVGWLAARPALTRSQTELEKDRALHVERLKSYHEAETTLREAFTSLSAQALTQNNEAFLHLAESRLREAQALTTAGIDERKKAIEDLLAPMARSL